MFTTLCHSIERVDSIYIERCNYDVLVSGDGELPCLRYSCIYMLLTLTLIMAIHLSVARAFLMQTLVRVKPESCRGHKCHRSLHKYSVQSGTHGVRRLSVGCNKREEEDSRKVSENVSFGRRRPLSPLERVSRLLPPGSLGPEVEHLRDCDQEDVGDRVNVIEDSNTNACVTKRNDAKDNICDSETLIDDISTAREDIARVSNGGTAADCSEMESQSGGGCPSGVVGSQPTSLPGEHVVKYGELLIAEFRKKNSLAYHKMFQVQEGAHLNSPWGTINHDDIAGRPAGRIMKTKYKVPFLIHRPSLEEYVLNMKRGPVITFPKVCLPTLSPNPLFLSDRVVDSRLDVKNFLHAFLFPSRMPA